MNGNDFALPESEFTPAQSHLCARRTIDPTGHFLDFMRLKGEDVDS